MEKSSLFHFLMRRFGAHFGVLLFIVSSVYYFNANTAKEDVYNVSLLEQSKLQIYMASQTGDMYLNGGKSKELDEYNKHILAIGRQFSELADNLKKYPTLQAQFSEVQKKSRVYFLSVNEKLEKKQKGSFHADREVASQSDTGDVVAVLDSMIKDIRENSSVPLSLFNITLPAPMWYFFIGLFFGVYCIFMGHQLQVQTVEDHRKDLSEAKIQSILLDGILNSISEALIVVDEYGNFTRYNTAAQRIIGTKIKSISNEDDAKEMGFFDTTSMQAVPLRELPFARALKGEQTDDLEFLVHNETHPEGIYIGISSRYLSDIDGGIRGALVVFRDISRRKATEQEWMRARESALETARKKSDFLAAMSHEIRTPMNGVMGMSTLLAETKMTDEQKDYVGTIKRSAEALLRLINDILDHSKIEAGKVQMHLRPFDLKVMCEDVLELFVPMVREKNIGLDLRFGGRDDWYFIGDPERIRQVLVNLIGNAVKFTEQGAVSIIVECVSTLRGKSHLKFSVMDTGAGFNEEESQFLFQKYFQTNSGMKYGGTGLGLSICHQLVELMGGKIGLKSKPGVGSTFWFDIELPETSAQQIPSQKEHHFAPIFSGRVLLAEDQIVNQRVAMTYLQKLGLEVDLANNGQVAAEKALQTSYDLIFMDCQMPVMTGYDATRKIREAQSGGTKTPIIALTAEGTSGERNNCYAAGMDDFLTKPLELERLVAVLHHWLKASPQILDKSALEKLKSYVVNNKSLSQALIEDFMKTAPDLVASMASAHALGDLVKIHEASHALKSTSATLGATGLAELCQSIDNSQSLEEIKPLLASVEDRLTQSLQELQKYLTLAAA